MNERYKVSFTCGQLLLNELFGQLTKLGLVLAVSRVKDKVPTEVKEINKEINPLDAVRKMGDAKVSSLQDFSWKGRKRGFSRSTDGARPVSQTDAGKICLAVFDHKAVAEPYDFALALKEEGYSPSSLSAVLYGLVKEGVLYRCSRGRYRRPTPMEELSNGTGTTPR